MTTIQSIGERVIQNVERAIVGKRGSVELALIALLCRGHLLVEDVPGVGKTVLAKSLARSMGCSFKRIQFTPDLLPSDVTGVSIYNQKTGEFEFRAGPIAAQIVLADEINRATPRTQSALLEAMEERQLTVDGVTRALPSPFLVMATQNPIEYEGTFPLPEAQLDRFLVRISLGYPSKDDELTILERQRLGHPVDGLEPVVTSSDLIEVQRQVADVYVDALVREYVVALVGATRRHPDVYLGASPRGSLGLLRSAQARSALQGRDFVIPDDVKALAEAVLAHRIIPKSASSIRGPTSRQLVSEVLESIPVPGARLRR